MKRSKFSEEQIAYALRQVEAGTTVRRCLPPARSERGNVLRVEEALPASWAG